MTSYLRRRLAMLRATLAHLDAHPDAWAGRAPIARNVETVREGLDALDRAAESQAAATPEGLTENRDDARDAAEARLVTLGRQASAYAVEAGDADLREAVDHSRSDWERMPEADFHARAEDALARIDAALAPLAEYGVEKEDVAAARAALAAARPLTAGRDNVRADRAVATDALGAGYTALLGPLDVLDRLVPTLADAAFVAEYRQVRRITGE